MLKPSYVRRIQIALYGVIVVLVAGVGMRFHRKYVTLQLLEACKTSNVGLIRRLVFLGADPNAQDENKRTPLTLVIGSEKTSVATQTELVKLLLEAGANIKKELDSTFTPQMKPIRDLLLTKTKLPITPTYFVMAVRSGDFPLVKEMVKQGAKVNQSDGDTTPLSAAVLSYPTENKRALVEYMLSKGADPNQSSSERLGSYQPLHMAIFPDNEHLAPLLLDAGAKVNGADKYGNTPLMVSIQYSSLQTITLLLKRGANPYQLSKDKKRSAYSLAQALPNSQRKQQILALLNKFPPSTFK